jgi:hypothetical protein
MQPCLSLAVDRFDCARAEFETLVGSLEALALEGGCHSVVEEQILADGMKILRSLYQAHLDGLSATDRRQAETLAVRRGEIVHHARRPLESLFGEVHLDRFAAADEAATVCDFALDVALNLPAELYSLPVRQRVAEHARSVSMEQTVKGIDRTTGAHVPKRQVEELVARAAQDFDAFYAQRPAVANDNVTDQAALVMTSDSKGITMVPHALRDGTRKLAAEAAAERPAHHDPMAPKKRRKHDKRMALVTAVYLVEPHVRTAADVVSGLSRTTSNAKKSAPPRPQNKTVTASVMKSQKAGIEAMFDEGERRDPKHQRKAVVLVDGEEKQQAKIEKEAKSRGWSITMILDLIHVLSYVWKAAAALCKSDPKGLDACVTTYLLLLLQGKARKLATQMMRLASKQGLSAEARKPVDRCVRYLRKNAKYMSYDVYLAAGYPIATGVIEGACRHLVEDRMGITGARWDLYSAEAVLRLRALSINGDWGAYWAFHERQHALRNARNHAV